MTARVAVLVSGRGSNLQALLAAITAGALDARIVYVASNHADVPALEHARASGVSCGVFEAPQIPGGRVAAQAAMVEALAASRPDLVVLAGFDRILEDVVFEKLAGVPLLNIHPSLLPKHGGPGMLGARVHAAVLAAGERESGCTVHLVERGVVDGGRIVLQRRVPVLPGDDVEALAARVLREEHVALVKAVRTFGPPRGGGSPRASSA